MFNPCVRSSANNNISWTTGYIFIKLWESTRWMDVYNTWTFGASFSQDVYNSIKTLAGKNIFLPQSYICISPHFCFGAAVLVGNQCLTVWLHSPRVTAFLLLPPIFQAFQQTNGTCGFKTFPVSNILRFTDKYEQLHRNNLRTLLNKNHPCSPRSSRLFTPARPRFLASCVFLYSVCLC